MATVEAQVSITSSEFPVPVTITSPPEPDTVKMTVKAEAGSSGIVTAPNIATVEPESIKFTAVSSANENQPTVTAQSAVASQPIATNQSNVSSQPTVANQPTGQKEPYVTGQPNLPSQPTAENQPTVAPSQQQQPKQIYQPQQEEFYRSIFYFSGMGRVIGSALAEGVYVDEKNRRNAIDPEEVERYTKEDGKGSEAGGGALIATARNQAVNLSSDFRKLQSLLGNLPTFTDNVETRSGGGGVKVDEPIHGEIYFRAERPDQYHHHQQQQQQQRQAYIIQPSYPHHQQNGHLIDVPWNYHSNY